MAKKIELQRQLDYIWINAIGKDISDLTRGKIHFVDEFLALETIFDRFDRLQEMLKEQKNKQ